MQPELLVGERQRRDQLLGDAFLLEAMKAFNIAGVSISPGRRKRPAFEKSAAYIAQ